MTNVSKGLKPPTRNLWLVDPRFCTKKILGICGSAPNFLMMLINLLIEASFKLVNHLMLDVTEVY